LIVLDASAAIEILLNSPTGSRLLDRISSAGDTLHVPYLLDMEVVQVLRRFVRSGDMSADRAGEALKDFLDMPLLRYPHQPFLSRVWELRSQVTAYDAVYLALAETLPAPLVTADRRLARTSGHMAEIEVI
jgi:predicted nucleic acid-binding protein